MPFSIVTPEMSNDASEHEPEVTLAGGRACGELVERGLSNRLRLRNFPRHRLHLAVE